MRVGHSPTTVLAASAEWIEELPTAVGSAQPTLANFGSATFTDMTYTPNGCCPI